MTQGKKILEYELDHEKEVSSVDVLEPQGHLPPWHTMELVALMC